MTKPNFADLIQLVRELSARTVDESEISGRLQLSDEVALERLRRCVADDETSDRTGVRLPDAFIEDVKVGDTVRVMVGKPAIGFGLIFKSTAEMLDYPPARASEPRRYYLAEPNFCNGDEAVPPAVERYRAMLKLIGILSKSAVHTDKDSGSILFVKKEKFDVPIHYSMADLEALDIPAVGKLEAVIVDDAQLDERLPMLSNAVVEMLESVRKPERFHFLLTHLDDLVRSYEASYKLFLTNFSYEKVRDEVEETRIDYTTKIHKAFSDIQGQVLGIPIATVIVATQMKKAECIGYEFWVNVAVLVGAWVFAALLYLVIRNQAHTLDVLDIEIQRQKRVLAKEYEKVADNFMPTFDLLAKRLVAQRRALWGVGSVALIGLILTHVVFAHFTSLANTCSPLKVFL